MNTEHQNTYTFEEEDTLNLREELDKYLRYWKWFVLAVGRYFKTINATKEFKEDSKPFEILIK